MSQNNLTTPEGPWTEADFPFPYIKTIKTDLFELHNTSFKYGYVKEIEYGPEGFPRDTLLKIEDEEGHEYDFRGLGAYEAVTRKYRRVRMYEYVHFFANEETKAVVAILIE